MLISEPTTTLTDYAIALETIGFAVALVKTNHCKRQQAITFWGLAFVFVAVAAILGGTCHGFANALGYDRSEILWHLMSYALGFSSFFMLLASVISTLPRSVRLGILGGIGLKSILYFHVIEFQNDFTYVVIDYLSAMAVVLILQLRQLITQPNSATWIIVGIVVSGLAATIHASRVTIAPQFNHNDIYHLIQMMALYCFYKGATLLKDQ
jgi:hypothetical protein